jgi:hypothetical protein
LFNQGQQVTVILRSGAEFEGTFEDATATILQLKMVLQKKLPGSVNMPNGNNRANREQANMSFSNKDVGGVRGSASKQQNGISCLRCYPFPVSQLLTFSRFQN